MQTIYLRRQGCSKSLNTNNRFDLPFHISVHPWQQTDKYIAEVCYSNDKEKWNDKRGQIAFTIGSYKELYDLITIKKLIEKEIFKHFNLKIQISNIIERYCYEDNTYNYCKNDIYFTCCVYKPFSNSIRLIPENYCLVAFDFEGTKDYLETDSATKQYLPILKSCAEYYKNEKKLSCNKDKSEIYLKGWFTWILSETLKEQFNLPTTQLKSLIYR